MSVAKYLVPLGRIPSAQDLTPANVHVPSELQLRARTRTEAMQIVIIHVGGNSYGTATDTIRSRTWWEGDATGVMHR